MASRLDWTGIGPLVAVTVLAVALTAWQVQVDRTVFERVLGPLDPVLVMVAGGIVGIAAMAHLQGTSDLAVLGPGGSADAVRAIAVAVPLLAAAAIAADVLVGFPQDMNVTMPDALRFYPAVAVFVELVLHVAPVAALVALVGAPTGLDATFWRVALPVAAIEAVLQTAWASSLGTASFSAVQLTVVGVVQVWLFWRYGALWMLGFRLAYYTLWHVAWGTARLQLLF